jgi:hypothetical protein
MAHQLGASFDCLEVNPQDEADGKTSSSTSMIGSKFDGILNGPINRCRLGVISSVEVIE